MNSQTKCTPAQQAQEKPNWHSALCNALFSYVIDKTGIFPKSMRNKYLFWANY